MELRYAINQNPVMQVIYKRINETSDNSLYYRDFQTRPAQKLLSDFIRQYLDRCHKTVPYKRMYMLLVSYLDDFSREQNLKIYTNGMNEMVVEDFIYYLRSVKKLMASTVKGVYDRLKAMLQKASNYGHPVDNTFRNVFVKDEDINTIALNIGDIARIYYYDNLTDKQKEIRDLFIVGCCTGLRYSDYSRLTKDNFIDDIIVTRTIKTGRIVKIPVHPYVRAIMKKRGDILPREKSIQYFNSAIKKICRKMGMNEPVLYERYVGTEFVRKTVPMYKLVSSHTARRSFATNLFLSKETTTLSIMQATGHKSESAFFKYVKISTEQNAKKLAGCGFFC